MRGNNNDISVTYLFHTQWSAYNHLSHISAAANVITPISLCTKNKTALSLIISSFIPYKSFICGAGGNRTLVQTRKSCAFYMLIFAFGFRAQARPKPPTCTLSSEFSPMPRGRQQLFPILLHHHIDELRKNSVRVMSRFSTLCRNKAYLLYFD